MKKKYVIGALIIMSLMMIVGVILIFSSVEIGQNAGHIAINRQGGTMDTEAYNRIINTTIINFQIVGAILTTIGGVGVLLSGFGLYKEL